MADLKEKVQRYLSHRSDRKFDYTKYSNARVGLGHAGGHLLTADWLNLQASFAQAKDAVFDALDVAKVQEACDHHQLPHININSQATDHMQFVLRPDFGRLVAHDCHEKLREFIALGNDRTQQDILLVVSGGLSPNAINKQFPLFLPHFLKLSYENKLSVAPVVINPRGRIALGDHLNELFKAKIVVVLIGERPGLTTSDSMSIYFTYQARTGCTDEQRNCISNIHVDGLSCEEAALKLIYLLRKALKNKLTGVGLKDDQTECLTNDPDTNNLF